MRIFIFELEVVMVAVIVDGLTDGLTILWCIGTAARCTKACNSATDQISIAPTMAIPWYLYRLVPQNMLRTYDVRSIFFVYFSNLTTLSM